jgi:hypothetical protein
MTRTWWIAVVLSLLSVARAGAQTPVVAKVIDVSTGVTTDVGDATDHAIRVKQVPGGTVWTFNWTQLLGAAPSATNPMPSRLTDGSVFIDPRSIRVLTSSDVVTVVQPTGTNLHVVVDAAPTTTVTGTFWQATQPVSGTVTTTPPGNASTNLTQLGGATLTIGQQLAAASMPVILPSATVTTLTPPAAITGFALEAGHLATIDTSTARLPAQGQALAAASLPVVLPAAQITTLTPPAAITGFALEAGNIATVAGAVTSSVMQANVKQVNGVTVLTGTGATGTGAQRLTVAVDSATVAGSASLPAGTNVIGHTINDSGSTTAVTGNVTAVQATGTNLHMVCDSGCSAGGSFADAAAFTAGTTSISTIGALFDDTPPTAIVAGHAAAPRITTNRGLHVNLRSAAGAELPLPAALAANGGLKIEGVAGGVAVPVSGTFFQGTQPISGTVTTTPPANASSNVAQIAGTTTVTAGVSGLLAIGGNVANAVTATANPVPIGGVFTTTPATLTTGQTATFQFTAAQNAKHDLTTIAGTAPTTVGKLDIKGADGDVFVRQATGTNLHAVLDTTSTTAVTQATGTNLHAVLDTTSTTAVTQATAANLNATVTQQTLTKGTQGATGISTQDLKDAGRASVMYTASVASTAVAETLITLTKSVGLAATTTCSSCTITTGKTFRIQAITATVRNSTGTTASAVVTLNLRAAVAGATTTASPLQMHYISTVPASTVPTVLPTMLIADGFEIASNGATNTWGLTIIHPQWVTASVVVTFDITLIGYEY